ncbi:hypothetical protein [Geobacter sp. OR-1]|uniref:hypothetical protein n=1 Tax=Geobacter sp. OR-1 TaxID=1266765 RepID=UPI0005A9D825|nr:hypothetical protein [Geobacter sp. OR-1]
MKFMARFTGYCQAFYAALVDTAKIAGVLTVGVVPQNSLKEPYLMDSATLISVSPVPLQNLLIIPASGFPEHIALITKLHIH